MWKEGMSVQILVAFGRPLKKIFRFATTSIPKKVENRGTDNSSINTEKPDTLKTFVGEDEGIPELVSKLGISGSDTATESDLIQSFIDKYQEKVEKEVNRTVKVCTRCQYCLNCLSGLDYRI